MKRIAVAILLLIVVSSGVLSFRAFRLKSRQYPPGTATTISIDSNAAAVRLAEALRFPTISWGDASKRDDDAFVAFSEYLDRSFPRVRGKLTRETVAQHSLLYTWAGTNPNLPPVIFSAHLDVVPVESESEKQWAHPPFGGVIADGSVWGRGAIDDKSGVLGIFEAVDALAGAGFAPARTVYLTFGHNEEGGGDASGAGAIAELLKARGVKDATLLDEGGVVFDEVPGVVKPVALVGIAEKGLLSIELRAHAASGHASMPPSQTAVGILAAALSRLERAPMPARLGGAAAAMFETLGPEMKFGPRVLAANLWLAKPLASFVANSSPQLNAILRTTFAPTMLEASPKENVLPTVARAIVNIRILPGDSVDSVESHIREVVGDRRVDVSRRGMPTEPSRVTAFNTPQYAALAASIRAVYPQTLVSPYLTIAATDARQYEAITASTFRFQPIAQHGILEEVHGVNEHLRVDAYTNAIRIYATIITNWAGEHSTTGR